jgi:transcriptional regulator with XRE-family HTH domain
MTPQEIVSLRAALACTPRELADALGVAPETVLGWEEETLFPTKRDVEAMHALAARGPDAIVRRRGRPADHPRAEELLADPDFWRIVRKLVAHPALRAHVAELADRFPDPAEPLNQRAP